MAMDFSDMLASSIHDIKNSLVLISTNLAEMISNDQNEFADPRQASLLQHEVQRVNHNLVQLLSLYKLGNEGLSIDIDEHNVEELLIECQASNQAVCNALGIELSYQCDASLNAFFDLEMVRSVIDSTIGNAQRYAKEKIHLSAEQADGFIVIRIEDDGNGFPEHLLRTLDHDHPSPAVNPRASGRTRLGLLFAEKISELHRAGEKHGRIQVKNGYQLPGGCFELWLP